MENIIVTRSLRRQLNQVVLHEQVQNGATINNNLSANQVDQWFETPKKVFQIKHKHPWTEAIPASHIMPQVAPIILHEVQTSEA
jgi:hypothetical protein